MVYASTYPTQPLRGLGALSAHEAASLPPLAAQVRAGLTDLVNFSRSTTSEIVASYKGSFTRSQPSSGTSFSAEKDTQWPTMN